MHPAGVAHYGAAKTMRLTKRKWLRFSLRAFLLTVTLLAVWLSTKVRQAGNQELAVQTIRAVGGRIRYDFEPTAEERLRRQTEAREAVAAGNAPPAYVDGPSAPKWFVERLGIDFFARVTVVDLSSKLCTNNDLASLRLLPHLKSLHLRHVPYVTSEGLAALRKLRLRTLILDGNQYSDATGPTGLNDDALAYVGEIRSLRHLDLNQNRFSDEGLKHLAQLRQLKTLGLQGTRVTGDGIGHLSQLKQLEALQLPVASVDSELLTHLMPLVSLERLPPFDASIDDEALQRLAGFTMLKGLSLRATRITSEGLKVLSSLGNLRSLDLAETRVDDTGLRYVGQLGRLESIQLEGTAVSDAGVQLLASCHRLTRVGLANTVIGDGCLEHLAKLPALEHLDLRATAISDGGLAFLTKSTSLRSLTLDGTRISDQGISRLRKLTLDFLSVRNTDVTLKVISSMQNCRYISK